MDSVFVDTNVLLCAFDERDAAKRERARAWISRCWTRRCGRVSTQVLDEFYANARKRFAATLSADDARTEMRRYLSWNPWITDPPTIETAWAVESRYGVNYWDALMIAAAQHQGCRLLLTEDLQHDRRIGDLRIVDPFRTGPELLDSPP